MVTTMYSTRIALFVVSLLSGGQIYTVGKGGHPQVSQLSHAQKAVLVPALQDATGDHRTDILRSFTVFEAPLSNTEPAAIIAISVSVGCGVDPNCEFLVFRQRGKKDVPILNDVAGDWDLKNTRHHGYRDLVLTNYQGMHTAVSVWQYDGRRYCMSSKIDRATDGSKTELPVTRCGSS
jgi:hypothetical protein